MERRTLLRAGIAGAVATAVTGCPGGAQGRGFVAADGVEVRAAEARRNPGTVQDFRLVATAGPVDLGGLTVDTWSYGGAVPGVPIRVTAGEVVRATLVNLLPEHTTVHWHGLALRNDADGVPGITQLPLEPGAEHLYQFTAAHPGTYWFHPHAGLQLDRGLYAPLIVDDPAEPLGYDAEWTVVLDDWLDGIGGRTPDAVFGTLRGRMGGHMTGTGTSHLLGGGAGDVRYPHLVLNGRLPAAPSVHHGRTGARLRLRLINAAADTAFRIALGGHRMTVTHADGYPVVATPTDAVLIGMGERYDAVVTLDDGVFPLVALAEGKEGAALGLIRTSSGTVPEASVRPRELDRQVLTLRGILPAESARLASRTPDRAIELRLTGGIMRYDWSINHRRYDPTRFIAVRSGERVRLTFVNATMMWHPVHLHGHTFAAGDDRGPRKDTAIVLPGQTLAAHLDADNPGRWMVHCHNAYHAEAGMMALLGYEK